MFKTKLGALLAFGGFIGMIGSAIAMRYWLVTLVIMTILKLTGVVLMPWFAGVFAAGAISTGLWMLFGGLIIIIISYIITAVGVILVDNA